jgi:hypothetical protein
VGSRVSELSWDSWRWIRRRRRRRWGGVRATRREAAAIGIWCGDGSKIIFRRRTYPSGGRGRVPVQGRRPPAQPRGFVTVTRTLVAEAGEWRRVR